MLRLPPEIRNRIYIHAIGGYLVELGIILHDTQCNAVFMYTTRTLCDPKLGLLRLVDGSMQKRACCPSSRTSSFATTQDTLQRGQRIWQCRYGLSLRAHQEGGRATSWTVLRFKRVEIFVYYRERVLKRLLKALERRSLECHLWSCLTDSNVRKKQRGAEQYHRMLRFYETGCSGVYSQCDEK